MSKYPSELLSRPQWICWRLEPDPKGGKDRKVPYNPKTGKPASSTDPATWATFEEARDAAARFMFSGLGFVFAKDDGIVGIDIDHCRDAQSGALNDTATAILARLPPTYAEISPSGTGIHLFMHGEQPGDGNKNSKSGVEMYAHSRYFTMTGNPLEGAPGTIATDEAALRWVHETYIKPPAKEKKAKRTRASSGVALSDEDVLAKARAAKNSADFIALFDGAWQERYASQSEADLSLCCALAFWTGKNKEQIDRLFRQSALFRPKWDVVHHANGATYGEETLCKALEATENVYNPSSESAIFESEGRYFRSKGDSVYPISNFIFKPLEMVVSEDETQMTADLVTVRGESFRLSLMTTDFNNLQKFKGVINKRTISLSYTGTEGDLELLKAFVSELPWTMKRGVKALGFYEHDHKWCFVGMIRAIFADGLPAEDIVQVEKHRSIDSEILEADKLDAETLRALGAQLLHYNEPAKTVSVLAWCAGCFLKEQLRRAHIKYPHLFLIGEAGSGKSNTLERVILPIFSRSKVVAATQVTSFTLMKESASSNAIPQALDEFKPSKIDRIRLNALYNHLRDTYDGHEGIRGRADQSSVNYALLAPLIVAGEESPDEAAIRERSIELLFSKKDLKDRAAREAFYALGTMREALGSLGKALLYEALGTSNREVRKWHKEAMGMFSDKLPSRILNNLACVMAGLRLTEKLCGSFGMEWGQVFDIDLTACAQYLQFAAREYLLDGGESNKSIVEQTLEIMDRMGLDPECCRLLEDGRSLAIHFRAAYDRYTKYRRDHAILGECLSYSQFMRQLRRSDLFIEDRTVRFVSEARKAAILDYTLLVTRCDVTTFSASGAVPLITQDV